MEQTMSHRRHHSRNWMPLLVCGAAISVLACAAEPKKTDGGAGGQGGGGSGSGGSIPVGAGGSAPGGAGGGQGGITGAGGASVPGNGGTTSIGTGTCAADAECVASGQVCEPVGHHCVQCVKTADCPAGQHCRGNACVGTPPACTANSECSGQVCDPARGFCVDCVTTADCTATPGQECVANTCVTPTAASCQSSLDCGAKVCDPSSKKCVDCAGDGDCNTQGTTSGVQHCIKNLCQPECISDKQCTPQGMLCDPTLKVCATPAQCKANQDCPASAYCDAGACKADVCDSTEAMCSGNGVAVCNAAGSGWAPVSNCPADRPCKAVGGAAGCGGPPVPIDGGVVTPPVDGGALDGPNASCTTATANPCTGIAKFDGVQTVDGKDDDLCQIPLFVLIKPAAQVVNNYNNLQDNEFPVLTTRLAWSAAGLHAFFDVQDSSVQSVAMKDQAAALQRPYQGDSIELFFSASDAATGAPGGDAGAIHVTLAATGPSVSVKTTNSGGLSTTYTELPAAQYQAVKTSAGYAVEALIPWAGAAPSAGGKVRFDLALNIADTNFSQVDDMRDAQMILNVTNVSGQTSCPGAAEPWCDDRTWCSSTLQP
jgi:hypothetical protein